MHRLVALVNGTGVFSDKPVASIVNTRVTFADGSWCDVSTGDVVNNGRGYIKIGNPVASSDQQLTFGPKRYTGKTVDIRDVGADVNIQPIDGKEEIILTIVGARLAVEEITARMQGSTLFIRGGGNDARIHASAVVSGRGAIAIGRGGVAVSAGGVHIGGHNRGSVNTGGGAFVGGSVTVNNGSFVGRDAVVAADSGGASNTKVTIGVPKGSAVTVAGIRGSVTIGDIDGPLHASVLGADDVKAGKVRDAILVVQGSGDISVAAVQGDLSMTSQGSGDIRVRGGSVGMLNVTVMGSGDVEFKGRAVNANLSVIGSGGIDVSSVKNEPIRNVSGSGDINVGNW